MSVIQRAAKVLHEAPGIECSHVPDKEPCCIRDASLLYLAGLLVGSECDD